MRSKILREAKQQEIDNFFQDQYDSLVVNQVNNISDRSLAEKNPIVEGVCVCCDSKNKRVYLYFYD